MQNYIMNAIHSVRTQVQQRRCMATLKSISLRLKSIKNIKKITQSMKLVSAAKYARAEKELTEQARPYAEGILLFYENLQLDDPQHQVLYLAIASDRGLCGGCHSSIASDILSEMQARNQFNTAKIFCVGDKVKSIFQRSRPENILMAASDIGRKSLTFLDACKIARAIFKSGFRYSLINICFNRFKTIMAYETTSLLFYTIEHVLISPKIFTYDSLELDILQNYMEFSLASLLYYTLKESACSEQSARMSAMDNSSKNAAELIYKLGITYNRTRQAAITRELIEIISGAAALTSSD